MHHKLQICLLILYFYDITLSNFGVIEMSQFGIDCNAEQASEISLKISSLWKIRKALGGVKKIWTCHLSSGRQYSFASSHETLSTGLCRMVLRAVYDLGRRDHTTEPNGDLYHFDSKKSRRH